MSITFTEAQQIVKKYISNNNDEDFELVITHIVEKSFGWIFYYNTKAYVETGDHLDALLGNIPLLVLKKNGDMIGLTHNIMRPILDFD